MGAYSQLKLVLWKNVILSLRQPVILCLELFWPITIFLLVLLLRKVVPPVAQQACYYNARALPSAGALPVLQSLICNIDNDCQNRSSYEEVPSYPGSKITELVHNLSPLVHDEHILNVIKALPVLARVLHPVQDVLTDRNVEGLLERGWPLREIVRDADDTKRILRRYARMSAHDADALLESSLNVPAVLNHVLRGEGGQEALPCSEATFRAFLFFNDSAVDGVRNAICGLAPGEVETLLNELPSTVAYDRLLNLVGDIMSKLGRQDVGTAMRGIADMVKAVFDVISEIPDLPAVEAAARQLGVTLQLAETNDFDFGIIGEVWKDFGQLAPGETREVVDRVVGWIGSTFGFPAKDVAVKHETSAGSGPDDIDQKDLAEVLNATVRFAESMKGGRQALSDVGAFFRSLEALADITAESTLAEVLDAIEHLVTANVNSADDAAKARKILFYVGRFFAMAVDLIRRDIDSSRKAKVSPFFSVALESLLSTLASTKHVNRISSSGGLLNSVCSDVHFVSNIVVPSDVSAAVLRGYTCHLFRDVLPAFISTVSGTWNATAQNTSSWNPMTQNVASVISVVQDINELGSYNYNWSRLSEASARVQEAWASMHQFKRISHAAKLLQITSGYITPQRPAHWNDVLAVFYMADQATLLVNSQVEKILRKGHILVPHIALDIPSLSSFVYNILNFVPDAINLAIKVVRTDLGSVIEKLLDPNLSNYYIPCRKGIFADLLPVSKKETLEVLEKNLCQIIPTLATEFFVEPHLAAIMNMLQALDKKQAVSFNWVTAGSHLIKLLKNVDKMKAFNGSVFPDVPALTNSKLDAALSNARMALGLPGSSPFRNIIQGFQLVSFVTEEMNANLNGRLIPILKTLQPFIMKAWEELSSGTGKQATSLSELFTPEQHVVTLVRWADAYALQFLQVVLRTLMHDPVKMSLFRNSTSPLEIACRRPVDDYLLLSANDSEMANAGIRELCGVDMPAISKWIRESNEGGKVPAQLDIEALYKRFADVLIMINDETDGPLTTTLANITAWKQFAVRNFGHVSSERRMILHAFMKGFATAFLEGNEAFTSLTAALSITACKIRPSLQNLNWNVLLETWKDSANFFAILQAINGSIDILSAGFDTILEPEVVKAIILDLSIPPGGLERFCSLDFHQWKTYLTISDELISSHGEAIHHLVCSFSTSQLIKELKSSCQATGQLTSNVTLDQLVNSSTTVFDEVERAFLDNTLAQFQRDENWMDMFISFWNLLKNGLVKTDLTKLDGWLSLLHNQIVSDKARREISLALQGAKTLTTELLMKHEGSSDVPLENLLPNYPQTLHFLKTWIPMLPTAVASLMSSIIVQHKMKEVSPLDNLRQAQDLICRKKDEDGLLCSDPLKLMFWAALCEMNIAEVLTELTPYGSNANSTGFTTEEMGVAATSLYDALEKFTISSNALAEGYGNKDKLTPWERFVFIKTLHNTQSSSRTDRGVQTMASLLRWKITKNTTNTEDTWNALNGHVKELMRDYRLHHDQKKLLADMTKFLSGTHMFEGGEKQDAVNVNSICKEQAMISLNWINEATEDDILHYLKGIAKISEEIITDYSKNLTENIGLYGKIHTARAIENFLSNDAQRPVHSAMRLTLSCLWMIHKNASSIPTWNAVVPSVLDMMFDINKYFELLPADDACFVDVAQWQADPGDSSKQAVPEKTAMLNEVLADLIPWNSGAEAFPTKVMRSASGILNITSTYLCDNKTSQDTNQALYKATAALISRFPDPKLLLCNIPQDTFQGAYRWISDRVGLHGYLENVSKIKAGMFRNDRGCATVPKVLAEAARIVYKYLDVFHSPKEVPFLKPCMDRILKGRLQESLERNYVFGSQLLKLGKNVLLRKMRSTNATLLMFLIEKITSQLPVYASFNQVVPEEVLREALENGQPASNSTSYKTLLRKKINLNKIIQRNFSWASLHEAFCCKTGDAKQCEKHLCDTYPTHVSGTLASMMEKEIIMYVAKEQKKSFYNGSWLYEIINHGHQLKGYVKELVSSSKNASSILNITSKSPWDTVLAALRLLEGDTIQRMTKGLEGILHILEPVFTGGPLVDSLRAVVTGLAGVDALEKAGLFNLNYSIGDLITDRAQLSAVLEKTENKTTSSVLTAASTVIDLRKISMKSDSYRKSLGQVLCLTEDPNETSGKMLGPLDIVRHEACSHSNTMFMSHSLSELITGRLLKNLGNTAFEGILNTTGLAPAKVSSALDNLSAAPTIIPRIQENFAHLTSALDTRTAKALENLNVGRDGVRVLATPAALKLVGTLMCGKPLKAIQDEFKLLEVSKKEPTLDRRETEELPSEFCRHGYEQIMRMTGGPIIWGFLKPILRGQILYSPNTPSAHYVMQQMNRTFDSMSTIIDALYAWGQGTSGLKFLIEENGALAKLKDLVTSGDLKEVSVKMLGKDMQQFLSQLNLAEFRRELSGLRGLLDFVELVGNISQCFELNRFRGYDTEEALEKSAVYLSHRRQFISAIVFMNLNDEKFRKRQSSIHTTGPLPPHIHYKIRVDIDNVPSTRAVRDRFWRPGPKDDFLDDMRYLRGFSHFQELIDKAILAVHTANESTEFPPTYLQQFPYPCYEKDTIGYYIKAMLPLAFILSWILLVAFFIRERVLPRELHLEEIMQVMGLKPWIDWTAWFLTALVMSFAILFVNTIILTLGGILPHSDVLLIFIFYGTFALSVLMYCYLVSTLFQTATIASLTGTVGFLVSFLPFVIAVSMEANLTLVPKLLLCLFMSSSFCYGCLYVMRFEEQGLGIQWGLLWSSPIPNDEMNLGYCILAMLVDSALYFALAWYISRVYPKNGNGCLPWYFVFWPPYWSCFNPVNCGSSSTYTDDVKVQPQQDKKGSIHGLGISIKNLHIAYDVGRSNERTAVVNLTMDFKEGQISTLLGQNGAGKTTTIKVLTGQHSPTSGEVFVYGKNVMDCSSDLRQFLGYCPQYNTLFGKLTVREHLLFFAKLKGQLSSNQVKDDVDIMLHQMGLKHVESLQACRLSGGLQRRLCVGLSFIGGSKLVILDEPTSSVDPVARRNIWDLILKCKQGRTILLTTHHMDEADILSDKVAIIHRGRLLSTGSPLMLKNKFGCGYKLSLTRSSGDPCGDNDSGHASTHSSEDDICNVRGILEVIRSIVPPAQVVEEHNSEVIISLPQRDPEGKLYSFAKLISSLDESMLEYSFSNYGLSTTTLEEVFISLCSMYDSGCNLTSIDSGQPLPKAVLMRSVEKEKLGVSQSTSLQQSSGIWNVQDKIGSVALTGISLKVQQLQALLQKRLYHTVSDWKSIFFSIVLPCLFIAMAMGFTLIIPGTVPDPPLRLKTDLYGPGAVAFVSEQPASEVSQSLFHEVEAGSDKLTDGENTLHSNNERSRQMSDANGQCRYAYSSGTSRDFRVPYIKTDSLDTVYNISGLNVVDYLIDTYPEFTEKRYGGWSFHRGYEKVWFENTGYHSLPAYQNALSNAILRSTLMRSHQSVTPSPLGITVYNHPLHLTSQQLGKQTIMNHIAEVGIAIVILMGLAFIPARVTVYIVNERARDEKQVQSVSGVGPALYWVAAFIWDMGLVFCTVMISAVVMVVFGLPVYTSRLNLPAVLLLLLLFGWGTTPLMYILSRLFNESSISFMVLYCVNLFIGLNIAIIMLVLGLMKLDMTSYYILGIAQKVALAFPQYALLSGLVDMAKNNIQAEVYAMFGQDTYEYPFSKHLLAYNYLAMFLAGIAFFLLNLLIEYVSKGYRSRSTTTILNEDQDSDVLAEQMRVSSEAGKQDVLRIVDLVKVYQKNRTALNHVSFGIPKGECFGLLGVNGAGKTTLFRILTGQVHPTLGSASIQETSLRKVYKQNIQLLGYCPQADALDDVLTSRQHLVIYSKIRGIQKHEIQEVVTSMLAKFNLSLYAEHKVKTLSRGTRRKLCTAISMLGNPQIVLLDEPTSGMDPVTRRLVWSNVSEAIKNKQSILLTSHSMAECDILCSRLAIMVNGKLCCIGSPQYLKHRFGAGYSVTIRMADMTTDWERAVTTIQSYFPGAVLKAHHCNIVEFSVPSREVALYSIFKFLEMDGAKLGITDFSVTQTTLDQVFVSFAHQQAEDETPYQSKNVVQAPDISYIRTQGCGELPQEICVGSTTQPACRLSNDDSRDDVTKL